MQNRQGTKKLISHAPVHTKIHENEKPKPSLPTPEHQLSNFPLRRPSLFRDPISNTGTPTNLTALASAATTTTNHTAFRAYIPSRELHLPLSNLLHHVQDCKGRRTDRAESSQSGHGPEQDREVQVICA